MSNKMSAEGFRTILMSDVRILSECRERLIISTNSLVELHIQSRIGDLFERWSRLVAGLREPEFNSVTALMYYLDYFQVEMERWKTKEMKKFNSNLNILYAVLGRVELELEELVDYGATSSNSKANFASAGLRKQIDDWRNIFPYLGGTGNLMTSSADRLSSRLIEKGRFGLDLCAPDCTVFDIANKEVAANSALASILDETAFPAVSDFFPVFSDVLNAPAQGTIQEAASWSRLLTIYSRRNVAQPDYGIGFHTYIIKGGGARITIYPTSQYDAAGMTQTGTNDNNNFQATKVPASGVVQFQAWNQTDNVAIGPIIECPVGSNIPAVVDLPYTPGKLIAVRTVFKISLANPGAEVRQRVGLWLNVTSIFLTAFKQLVLATETGIVTGVPKVIDVIGSALAPISQLTFNSDVSWIWQMLRSYNSFLVTSGQMTMITALITMAGALQVDTTVLDERVLSLDWWLCRTADYDAYTKKRLFRLFYQLLDDYIVMAASDVGFVKTQLGI